MYKRYCPLSCALTYIVEQQLCLRLQRHHVDVRRQAGDLHVHLGVDPALGGADERHGDVRLLVRVQRLHQVSGGAQEGLTCVVTRGQRQQHATRVNHVTQLQQNLSVTNKVAILHTPLWLSTHTIASDICVYQTDPEGELEDGGEQQHGVDAFADVIEALCVGELLRRQTLPRLQRLDGRLLVDFFSI